MDDNVPDIFDRRRRQVRRVVTRGEDFITAQMVEALLERLSFVTREFARALIIGARSPELTVALAQRGTTVDVAEATGGMGLTADPDLIDVEPGHYDLIIWPGGLDSVNDVPGALMRARFALRPDGLMLGAFVGDGSFPMLRTALRNGAMAAGRAMAGRMQPQISLQAMGALLQRSGFALPVVDVDDLALRYRTIDSLVRDLRGAALTALMAGPVPPLTRYEWAAVAAAFTAQGDGGVTRETLRIVHFSGWAPDASQPQPARRGSATASLATALAKAKDQPPS